MIVKLQTSNREGSFPALVIMLVVLSRAVSFRVKKRFPDLQHLVDAGLMREDEYKVG